MDNNSYSYKKKIPYSLLIDLITHSFQIREGDSPKRIKLKINLGLNDLLGKTMKSPDILKVSIHYMMRSLK